MVDPSLTSKFYALWIIGKTIDVPSVEPKDFFTVDMVVEEANEIK